jgi:hypothetical protein
MVTNKDYKTIKLSLEQILIQNNDEALKKITNGIQDAVSRTNTIMRHAMFFLKLYILHDPVERISKLNTNFLDMVLKAVCVKPKNGRPSSTNCGTSKELSDFYDEHFAPLLPSGYERLKYNHLNTVLDYTAEGWITMIENNIKQQYISYVESYVNLHFGKRNFVEDLKTTCPDKNERDKIISNYCRRLRKIKTGILTVDGTECKYDNENDETWVKTHKMIVLPRKDKFAEKSVYYDIQCSPIDYLPCMFRIVVYIENSKNHMKPKLKNFLPLRKGCIPKHVKIDTTTLQFLTKSKTTTNLKEEKYLLWNDFFRMDKKCFRMKGYTFNNSIVTDGISCCILFIKDDLYGKKYHSKKVKPIKEKYLDELDENEMELYKNHKVVGLDPNMGNLIYCTDDNNKIFRYTQGQRRFEMKLSKMQKFMKQQKKTMVGDKSIQQWEDSLSLLESKTTDIRLFKEYLKERFKVDEKILPFYYMNQIRKNSLHSYRNTRNSENKMIYNFKETYGNKTIVCFGDWEQSTHRKFKEPVKGKGFRTLLRRFGIATYLVDEFRTSLQCNNCKKEEGKMEKFLYRSYVQKGEKKTKLLHGLLKCKTCDRICNRDANSSRNIRDIGENILKSSERPKYLQRKH